MSGFWLMFRHEYRKKTAQRGFLVTTLGVPLVILLMMCITILITLGAGGSRAIGIVDEAHLLVEDHQPVGGGESVIGADAIEIRAYPDQAAAEQALVQGALRAYYVIPAAYPQTGRLEVVYLNRAPNESMRAELDRRLRAGLAARLAGHVDPQLVAPPAITVRSADGSREISQGGFASLILPFIASFILIFAVMMTGGALLQVVAEEKENRTIEILVTSLTPEQLIAGKALALMAVCLTQVALWLAAGSAALAVASLFIDTLRQVTISWDLLALVALFFVPAYALIAAIMTAIGGAAGDMRQSQQIGGLLNLVFLLPLFLATQILQDPDSALVVALTLFPPTAFSTIMLRWSLGSVPMWQLAASWLLLTASSAATVLMAARVFRLGMLQYGQDLSLRAVRMSLFHRS